MATNKVVLKKSRLTFFQYITTLVVGYMYMIMVSCLLLFDIINISVDDLLLFILCTISTLYVNKKLIKFLLSKTIIRNNVIVHISAFKKFVYVLPITSIKKYFFSRYWSKTIIEKNFTVIGADFKIKILALTDHSTKKLDEYLKNVQFYTNGKNFNKHRVFTRKISKCEQYYILWFLCTAFWFIWFIWNYTCHQPL